LVLVIVGVLDDLRELTAKQRFGWLVSDWRVTC
jgi:hypothetical protein